MDPAANNSDLNIDAGALINRLTQRLGVMQQTVEVQAMQIENLTRLLAEARDSFTPQIVSKQEG